MASDSGIRKSLRSIFIRTLWALFLIPLCALGFTQHARNSLDADYFSSIEKSIDADAGLAAAQKTGLHDFYQHHRPASMCSNSAPELASYQQGVCARYSALWQFALVHTVSIWMLGLGLLSLAMIGLLSALTFASQRLQYWSLIAGWRVLTLVSTVEVLIQGSLAVWLSFWLTAFFMHVYVIKLILIIGLLAAAAMLVAVVHIFKTPKPDNMVEGELVSETDAPRLWATIRTLAARLQTAAPTQIVAGIDNNFFVTQSPLVVAGQTITGRTLFVSLPLLRILDQDEANAVLAHELAHLCGGDTASSAALNPTLVRYDHYCQQMREGGVTLAVYYLMTLYRMMFELAYKRDSREREFIADRTAARLVSAEGIAHSLLKVAAYSSYRARIEGNLFGQLQQHGAELGIARYVAEGLPLYATSNDFLDAMQTARIPHPFDSHPPLLERMKNAGYTAEPERFGEIVTRTPQHTWVSDIQTAPEIESRLWNAYESRFAAAHEQSLAYRYLPANDGEAAVVLKYFPTLTFALGNGSQIGVHYAGLILPDQTQLMPWDDVANLKYEDGLTDTLLIEHPKQNWSGAKSIKVKLPGIKTNKKPLQSALGHYWHRHKVARTQAAEAAAEPAATATPEPVV